MSDPRDDRFAEPDATTDWNVYSPAEADPHDGQLVPARPSGPRLAAHGVIVTLVAALLVALGILADLQPLAWLAGAAAAAGIGMVLAGYRRYVLDA